MRENIYLIAGILMLIYVICVALKVLVNTITGVLNGEFSWLGLIFFVPIAFIFGAFILGVGLLGCSFVNVAWKTSYCVNTTLVPPFDNIAFPLFMGMFFFLGDLAILSEYSDWKIESPGCVVRFTILIFFLAFVYFASVSAIYLANYENSNSRTISPWLLGILVGIMWMGLFWWGDFEKKKIPMLIILIALVIFNHIIIGDPKLNMLILVGVPGIAAIFKIITWGINGAIDTQ